MTDGGRALRATRPVAAGSILIWRECATFGSRAGQHVVTVRCKTHTWNDLASLAQRRIHAELVIVAVQIVDVLSDYLAFEILPRAGANTVTRIYGRLAVGSRSEAHTSEL